MSDQPFDEGGFTPWTDEQRAALMELDEVDPALSWLLRRAGDEWGPLGVARVAAQLAGHTLVSKDGMEPPPDPIWIQHETGPSWPVPVMLAVSVMLAIAGLVALVALVAIL